MNINNDKAGVFQCGSEDKSYPTGLRKYKSMPKILYYKGDIEIINSRKNIAVIGSRRCSEMGMRLAYETGYTIGKAGMNLVNGLAIGCDTEALRGALDAGGRCIAIMPCGLDEIQPKSNQKLAGQILQNGGCLISEYPVGSGVKKYQYVERDRLQSGISQGIVVIEAELESGTMHTVDFAMKQYKRLACYAHKLLKYSSANQFLEENGKAEILQNREDIIKFVKEVPEEENYQQMTLF